MKVCWLVPIRIVLRERVPRSLSRSWRLWTRWPSAVRALPALAIAAGERRAGATGSAGAIVVCV